MDKNNKKTIVLEANEKERMRIDKLQQKLYHTNEIIDVMSEVAKSYMEDVVLMKDEQIGYDRSEWVRKYGRENGDEDWDTDIHTIAILLEQVRRFGRIYYDTNKKSSRLD